MSTVVPGVVLPESREIEKPFHQVRATNVLFVLATCVASVAGLFVNFYRLSAAPLLSDESGYATYGWSYVHWGSLSTAQRAPLSTNGEHPPLAKLLFGVAELMVGHESITAARAVSAACTVVTAVVLGLWLARAVDRWTGLLAGAALALIPESVFPETTRFGRSAMLDTVACLFMVLSLVAGWTWFRSSGWRAWAWATAAGVAVGLATSSKENGFLGLIVPAVAGVLWCLPRWRETATRAMQTGYASVIAFGTFALTYLPLGDLHARLSYLVHFQLNHRHDGHLVGLAGEVTMHPPWWANVWFAGQGLGVVLGWLILLTALAGVVLRRDRLVWWCLAAVAGPFVFHSFIAGVTLPFYWVMWLPAPLALSAIGMRLSRGSLNFGGGP